MTRTVVLTTHSTNQYLIGEAAGETPLEDLVGDKIRLSGLVRATLAANPENPNNKRMHINPILVSDTQWVDLRGYAAYGYLKEDLLAKYRAWKASYENHEQIFGDANESSMERAESVAPEAKASKES